MTTTIYFQNGIYNGFVENQHCSLEYDVYGAVVTAQQNWSTPGIKTTFLVPKGTNKIKITAHGYSVKRNCFLWLIDSQNKKRLFKNYVYLGSRLSNSVLEVNLPNEFSKLKEQEIELGILFTGPPQIGDQFHIYWINIQVLKVTDENIITKGSVITSGPINELHIHSTETEEVLSTVPEHFTAQYTDTEILDDLNVYSTPVFDNDHVDDDHDRTSIEVGDNSGNSTIEKDFTFIQEVKEELQQQVKDQRSTLKEPNRVQKQKNVQISSKRKNFWEKQHSQMDGNQQSTEGFWKRK